MLKWWIVVAITLLGVMAAVAVPAPPVFNAMIGTPDDARIVRGVQAPEHNAEGTFRWTDAEATIRLVGFESVANLVVSVRATPPQRSTPTPLDVTFQADRLPPLHVSTAPAWRTYHFWVPRGGAGWTPPTIHIRADPVRASDGDDRKVGLALRAVEARASTGISLLAAAQRALFLASLFGILFVVGSRTLGTATTLVVPMLALGVAGASWRWPIPATFWLPQLWTIAGAGIAAITAPPLVRWVSRRLDASWIGIVGTFAALVGTLLLASRLVMPLGWGLLIGGSLMAAAALPDDSPRGRTRRVVGLALVAIVAAALAARFVLLGSLPFGLWRDEARYGILARQILTDPAYRPIYVPGGVDYPALLFYLTALVIDLIGVRIESVRVVAALAGSLAPLSLFVLGRRLVGSPAALVAAALMALAAWHISISRISFVAVLDPLCMLAGLAALWAALDARAVGRTRRAWLLFALSGCALGLALYTYHTARVMPILAAWLCAMVLGRSTTRWRAAAPGLALVAALILIVAAPLGWYALTSSDRFNLRVSQTSILRVAADLAVAPTSVLDMNLQRYLLMWHAYGEPNGRHYAPNRPMLDIVTGAAAMIGLWRTLRRMERTDIFLLGWFLIELIPPLLSEGAPHAVRSVGLIAPAMLLAGRAMTAVGAIWARRWWLIPVGGVVSAAALNLHLYFGVMPYDPAIWRRFNAPETTIAVYLRDHASEGPFAVPRRIARHDVVAYLAPDVPLTIFNRDEPVMPFASGTTVLIPEEGPREERQWVEAAIGEDAHAIPMSPYPGTNRPTFWMYRVP